jgi:CHAT domain-containing protein
VTCAAIPGQDSPAVFVSALIDVVAAYVWDDEEVLAVPAAVQLRGLAAPENLGDLPLLARIGILLVTAQAYEARAAGTADHVQLAEALEVAERCADMLQAATSDLELQDESALAWAYELLTAVARTLASHFQSDADAAQPGCAHARALALAGGNTASPFSTGPKKDVTGKMLERASGMPGCWLAELLEWRFGLLGKRTDLAEAIATLERITAATVAGAAATKQWHMLVHLLRGRLALTASKADLDRLADLLDAASADPSLPEQDQRRHAYALAGLIGDHAVSFERPAAMRRVEEILTSLLTSADGNDPMRREYQAALGMAIIQSRPEHPGTDDLERAIGLISEALEGLSESDHRRVSYLRDLAVALRTRGERDNSLGDLDRSVELLEQCIPSESSAAGELRSLVLNSLGRTLMSRYRQAGRPDDIDRAIQASTDAAAASGTASSRTFALRNLYRALASRYAAAHRAEDLDAMSSALRNLRELSRIPGEPEPGHAEYLQSVTGAVWEHFAGSGDRAILAHAIEEFKAEAAAATAGSEDEYRCLIELAEMRRRLYGAGGDSGQLEEAIVVLDDALARMPAQYRERATALTRRAMCLRDRHVLRGSPADLEMAITDYTRALSLTGAPEEQAAEISVNLSLALWDRYHLTGSLYDLDQAIALIRHVLPVIPASLAEGRANILGIALLDRYREHGNLADLQQAVELLQGAAEACPAGAPIRGTLLSNLGNAWLHTYLRTNDLAALTRSIGAYEDSVQVSERGAPDRPRFLCDLANGLMARYQRTRQIADLERAVQLGQEASAEAPENWTDLPVIRGSLAGHAQALYLQTGRRRYRTIALDAYQSCCSAGLDSRPGPTLRAARRWSEWALTEGAWEEAARASDTAIMAMTSLVETQYGRRDKEAWLEEADGIPARAGYAHAMLGNAQRAVTALETGRALQLSEALGQHAVELDELSAAGRGQLVDSYRSAAARYAALAQYADDPPTAPPTRFPAEVTHAAIAESKNELDSAINGIRAVLPHFMSPPSFDDIALAAEEIPLVYLAATSVGGIALIVWGRRRAAAPAETVWLPNLTSRDVRRRLSDLLESRALGAAGGQSWQGAVDTVAAWSWGAIMEPVLAALRGEPAAALIPMGYLSLIPLHAAWTPDPLGPTGRRYATDEITLSYTPNARAQLAAGKAASRATRLKLLVVEDPRPTKLRPLPFARTEAAIALGYIGRAQTRIIRHEHAELAIVTDALPRHSVVHFACHGEADLSEPLNSCLTLANDERLTLAALLHSTGLRRHAIRLAILSSCESHLSGVHLADEVIGLPAGMLQAGAVGVIASQWPVSGLTTTLLMARFYSAWHTDGQEPTAALRTAQRWLRDTTNAEKAQALDPRHPNSPLTAETLRPLWRQLVRKPPDERSFATVSDWAAFSYTGA